jgi:ferredoxin
MPVCPMCRSEYRPDVQACVHCEVDLVDALPLSAEGKAERLRAAVATGQGARPIGRASYLEACQMAEQLHGAGVDAMVTGDAHSCGKGGSCSHFFVQVLEEDVPSAAKVLRADWKKLVEAEEGLERVDVDAAVDLDGEGAHACPACGATFQGAPQECPECGLFLGTD